MREEVFRMERVTYRRQGILYLEDFNLQIYEGEIMGLFTMNAHGLRALMTLLQTNDTLEDGYVYVGGKCVNSWKNEERTTNRISIIGAASRLVEDLSVTDNIFVLRKGFRQNIIREDVLRKQLAPFLDEMDMNVSVDGKVSELSAFERVIVELLRALVLEQRLIVLDDVGMLVSEEELGKLHEIMRTYARRGFSFLYVCPHFEEIARICDRAAHFSNGRIQRVIRSEDMGPEVNRAYTKEYITMVQSFARRERGVWQMRSLEFRDGSGRKALSFLVGAGECLALQMRENELYHAIRGVMLGEGRMDWRLYLDGRRSDLLGDRRIALIQEYATQTMIFPELGYLDNLCMSLSRRLPGIWRSKSLQESIRREYGEKEGEDLFERPVRELSEKQKYWLIYQRVLLQKPELVICIQPFAGADQAHRMYIWEMIEQLLKKDIAVVLLSLNLSDALALADRLLIVGGSGGIREFTRENFEKVRGDIPWKNIGG